MSDNDVVILSAVRTAQGRFQGGFAGTSAVELGAIVMKEALERAGVTGEQLDEVIFGNVIQAGLGQNTARQAELKAGIPWDVPAMTVNRVCVSSASALAMAATNIKAGEGEIYLVGGTENMTRAPWLLQNGRSGYRMGMPSDEIFDAMVLDGLWCAIGGTTWASPRRTSASASTSARSSRTRSPTAASSTPRAAIKARALQGRDRARVHTAAQGRSPDRGHRRVPARDHAGEARRPRSRSSRRTAAW